MSKDALLFASKLAREYVDPARGYHVAGLCAELGVKPAVFARLTHRETEAVARLFSGRFVQPKEAQTRVVLGQMHQIVALFRAMGWTPSDTSRWMHSPLPTHDGQTPLDVIERGRGQNLIDQLTALAVGNVGS